MGLQYICQCQNQAALPVALAAAAGWAEPPVNERMKCRLSSMHDASSSMHPVYSSSSRHAQWQKAWCCPPSALAASRHASEHQATLLQAAHFLRPTDRSGSPGTRWTQRALQQPTKWRLSVSPGRAPVSSTGGKGENTASEPCITSSTTCRQASQPGGLDTVMLTQHASRLKDICRYHHCRCSFSQYQPFLTIWSLYYLHL
jgi:hypothetical protein